MPRRSIRRPELEPHQRELARMIASALDRGQRGDGTPEKLWVPWTSARFAEDAKVSERSVGNWRDPNKLMPPEDIEPLLKSFYGFIELHKIEKAKMKKVWQLARGYIVDDSQAVKDWDIHKSQSLQGTATLVRLETHPPVPWNEDGTVRLWITLIITPDHDLSYHGKAITIGLTEALLCVEPGQYQPAHKSRPSQRGITNFTVAAGGERIVGPRHPTTGMIDGEPLGDEYLMALEEVVGGSGPITIAIHVPRGCFRVLPHSSEGSDRTSQTRTSVSQDVVINALFHEQLRDQDDHNRAVIARGNINLRAR